MAYGYRTVNNSQLSGIVERLSRPTAASRSWNHDYDAQQVHVDYLRSQDPYFQPRRTASPEKLDGIIKRLRRKTRASTASNYNFDNQEANLIHLNAKDPKISLRKAGSASSMGSRSGGSTPDDSEDNVSLLSIRKSQQKIAIGSALCRSNTSQSVSSSELDAIVGRLTKPTVSSKGGVDYANRKWVYIPTPNLKTLPIIPGLDTKYMCRNRKMSEEEFDNMVSRLTKATRASVAKTLPNPHTK